MTPWILDVAQPETISTAHFVGTPKEKTKAECSWCKCNSLKSVCASLCGLKGKDKEQKLEGEIDLFIV